MYGRFKYDKNIFYGDVVGKDVYGNYGYEGWNFAIEDVEILPPSTPSKIICVGLNYEDHAKEFDMPIPKEPVLFMKPTSSIIAHGEKIVYPAGVEQLDYEGELAVIIGKKCRNIEAKNASDVIAGYTCFNDITARDLQRRDGQWTRAKSFDTFAPIGPYIARPDEFDPKNSMIYTYVNDEICQSSNTSNLIADVPRLVEFISSIMTLEVGDIIATGTPPGVGELHVGDNVKVKIEGIGTLSNEVI
ncbi:fumarylacetoacetate hydrolase family protein [Methanosalsum natronophilum]|uniref:fumarylacetoacetate hydrolase family protein n=1 Tax=Methanosalsum natronophilum TaxID=768733 RepID=UPI00216A09B0|nr:fumarylacetoacetate hydrolase family protein [Methanosalsum natronophilum]MCS3923351.1 2-keto-4-pentenoate hydratase/2-oxohepta-3-ene-1,7-dioic acid hydratase in catechol pathway [Methanosalsum natronophilum]